MRKQFLMNLLLSFIWVALTGDFISGNFFFGFILSFFIMYLLRSRDPEEKKYFSRVSRGITFIIFFLYELIKANLRVAYHVVSPGFNMTPGIVRVPLSAETDLEITLLANIISLTPGTLSLDVSDDKKVLYIHSMNIKDRESFIQEIKMGFEKRLLEILR